MSRGGEKNNDGIIQNAVVDDEKNYGTMDQNIDHELSPSSSERKSSSSGSSSSGKIVSFWSLVRDNENYRWYLMSYLVTHAGEVDGSHTSPPSPPSNEYNTPPTTTPSNPAPPSPSSSCHVSSPTRYSLPSVASLQTLTIGGP